MNPYVYFYAFVFIPFYYSWSAENCYPRTHGEFYRSIERILALEINVRFDVCLDEAKRGVASSPDL